MYDDRTQHFKIDKSTLSFRPEDVAFIMGLEFNGDVVSFKPVRVQANVS